MQFTSYAPARSAAPAHAANAARSRRSNAALWSVQGVLAAIFLFAGAMKLVLPISDLQGSIEFPALFIRFIGVCEVSGAAGLILPGVLGIRRGLTPLAAAGLVVIMTGAVTVTVIGDGVGLAVLPLIVGALAATIAITRSW